MSSDINDFVVETEGHCFFCHDKISKPKWESQTEPAASQIYSLQYFSRYLKLDMTKVFHEEGPVPPHLVEMVKGAKLKAELCQECVHFTEAFSKLYRNLEKINLELAFMLGIFQQKLSNATTEESKQSRHTDENAEVSGKRKIVVALRNETIQKCSKKLAGPPSTLQVKLQNMTGKQVTTKQHKIAISAHQLPSRSSVDPEVRVNEVKMEPDHHLPSSFIKSEDYEDSHGGNNQTLDYSDYNEYDETLDDESTSQQTSMQAPAIAVANSNVQIATTDNQSRLNTTTNKIECTICSKQFSKLDGFRRHYESAHLKIKYKCNLCDKEFSRRDFYTRHHNVVHLGIQVKCEICNEAFKRKDSLLRHHRKMHPGEKVPLVHNRTKND